jgi:hypothetical protein
MVVLKVSWCGIRPTGQCRAQVLGIAPLNPTPGSHRFIGSPIILSRPWFLNKGSGHRWRCLGGPSTLRQNAA